MPRYLNAVPPNTRTHCGTDVCVEAGCGERRCIPIEYDRRSERAHLSWSLGQWAPSWGFCSWLFCKSRRMRRCRQLTAGCDLSRRDGQDTSRMTITNTTAGWYSTHPRGQRSTTITEATHGEAFPRRSFILLRQGRINPLHVQEGQEQWKAGSILGFNRRDYLPHHVTLLLLPELHSWLRHNCDVFCMNLS